MALLSIYINVLISYSNDVFFRIFVKGKLFFYGIINTVVKTCFSFVFTVTETQMIFVRLPILEMLVDFLVHLNILKILLDFLHVELCHAAICDGTHL